ncbi:MAG: YihY/virulence factor BrkB family protein [Planctomycetaceae bacterium]|nr:YihY/virulence factor BrkB family protein [Planctomycetaceae bacterium]
MFARCAVKRAGAAIRPFVAQVSMKLEVDKSWWAVLAETFSRWNRDDGNVLSAAMAYYASFSIFPLCLILMAGFGYLSRISARLRDQQHELLRAVEQNAGAWLAERLDAILTQIESQAQIGGPLGLLALIVTAAGVFSQLELIFDRIWDVPPPPSSGLLSSVLRIFRTRAVGLLMLIAVGAAFVAVFLANIVLSTLRPYAVELPAGRYAWRALQVAATLLLNAGLLATVYRALPPKPVRWRQAVAGGIFVAVLWQLGQLLLEVFVIGDRYNAYGVIGSFIAVMLWMYYACAALFLGAEFVQVLQQRSGDRT